jgi:hypothetical protein
MELDSTILALREQVACYGQLAKLAAQQHVHVQQNQTEALLEVLRRRQGVLDEVTRLEAVIGPVKRRWGEYLDGLSKQDRAEAEKLVEETRRLLEEITTADRNDAMVLQQRKLNVGKQINQAMAARQVNRTYAAAAYGRRASRMDVGG